MNENNEQRINKLIEEKAEEILKEDPHYKHSDRFVIDGIKKIIGRVMLCLIILAVLAVIKVIVMKA